MADGVEMEIEWSKPLRELREKLPKAAEVLTDMERLAEQYLFPQLRSHVNEVYTTQGAAAGKRWADYSAEPKYAAFKSAVLGDHVGDRLPVGENAPGGLLRWAGQERLFPSLTNRSHPQHVEGVDGMRAEYGTTVEYAERLFDLGGTGPFGESYPARPVLQFSAGSQQRFFAGIEAYFRDRLKDVGVL